MSNVSDANYASQLERLTRFGQEQVFRYWERLDDRERADLLADLAEIDLRELATLLAENGSLDDSTEMVSRAEGIDADRWLPGSDSSADFEARRRGEELLSTGKVGVVIVAGGQGTRLGFDRPKGLFPIGPASGRTLFEFLFDMIAARSARYGRSIPTLVMTSDATDAETRDYFRERSRFGLAPDDLIVFRQGRMPIVDRATGKLLLESRSRVAMSPDGHGGMLAALVRDGLLARLRERGIEELFYCQVDNPLVDVAAPEILGFHSLRQADLTTLVVRKREPLERVGNVVRIDDSMRIIEYSDLPREAAESRSSDGGLKLWAGNTAIHVMSLAFLERAAGDAAALPFHRAIKQVPRVDLDSPEAATIVGEGIKFERFIFDLMPNARRPAAIEIEPADLFAPVKNASGAPSDSPDTSRAAISARARRWLAAAGIDAADGAICEISPFLALDPQELASRRSRVGTGPVGGYLQ